MDMTQYKTRIRDNFFATEGGDKLKDGSVRVCGGRIAIADAKRATKDKALQVEIMLYYIQTCIDFCRKHGYNQKVYSSMLTVFKQIAGVVVKGGKDFFDAVREDLHGTITQLEDGDVKDSIMDIYVGLEGI